jgi:hypothetical protein
MLPKKLQLNAFSTGLDGQPARVGGGALNLFARLLALFHFLHHRFIVGHQHSAKAGNLFAPQGRDESSKRGIEGLSALREANAVA